MIEILTQTVSQVSHLFATPAGQPTLALLTVGAYAAAGLILYSLTRGKEFLIAGYSSVLFLAPFVNFH